MVAGLIQSPATLLVLTMLLNSWQYHMNIFIKFEIKII